MLYLKPIICSVRALLSPADSQYGLIVTAQGCPNLANAPFKIEGLSFLVCADPLDLPTIHATSNQTGAMTCANIGGTYTLTLQFSEAHVGSGLSCTNGETTIVIPLDVSPDLPEDCILDTLSSGSSDSCG